jgi:OmcA/MtrC family decaheme c-type cytochrome
MDRWFGRAATALATVMTIAVIGGACGDNDDDNDGGGGGGGTVTPVDPDPLNLEIQAATVPEGGGAPTVRFRVTDQAGNPIDLATEVPKSVAPATFPNTNPRFTLAMLKDDGDYLSYYATLRAPAAYTFEGTLPTPQPRTQAQAQTVSAAPAGSLVAQGNGVYEFTFPAPTVTEGFDRTKTHTVAGWVVRTPAAGSSDVAFSSFNFVPAGGTAQKDEVITDAACNRCHGVLQAHGTRRGTQLCLTCHSPQTGDPETDRTVDFKVMIHKIHSGRDLPSVNQTPAVPYFIVGNAQTVHDFSEVAFPWHDGVQHCTVCHTGEDANNWKTKGTFTTCTSCHDNVKFAGQASAGCNDAAAAPFQDCNHTGGAVGETANCLACHGSGGAANLAVDAVHHGD